MNKYPIRNNRIQFACPNCFTSIDKNLICPQCGFTGLFREGKFYLHRNDETWDLCLEQNVAVVKADIDQSKGFPNVDQSKYKSTLLEMRKALRGLKSKCGAQSKDEAHILQDKIIERLQPVQDKSFVEIGGQTGWATKRFIGVGALVGAIVDISDRYLPPSTNRIISVVGDGYYLPFINDQFDFAFDCATLHHFLNITNCLREIKRVLKPDGVYYSQSNPHRLPDTPESDTAHALYWTLWGLIETQPSEEEYRQMFNEVFGNFEFVSTGSGVIMMGRKQNE